MYKNLAKKVLGVLSLETRIKLIFFIRLGYFPNLKNPKTFNEKIQYRKMHELTSKMIMCSDKLAVREYVAEKIGEQYLIPLLYSGDTLSIADLENLGSTAVAKATHDSGNVHFIEANNQEKFPYIVKKIKKSLKSDFGKLNDEPWYSKIKPKVVIEQMLKTKNGEIPSDYKFHVFNTTDSTEIILQVCNDRFTNFSRSFFNANGDVVITTAKCKNKEAKLPENLNLSLMYPLVKKLSSDFNYVRVDMYDVDGVIYFGELTFAHEAGFDKFCNKETDLQWGDKWKLTL